jgi:hypothetical protein
MKCLESDESLVVNGLEQIGSMGMTGLMEYVPYK